MSTSKPPEVGVIGWASTQGIAHIARDLVMQNVAHRVLLVRHPMYANDPARYVPGISFSPGNWQEFVEGLDVLVVVEAYLGQGHVVKEAARRGVKVVVIPMYEYSPNPFPEHTDLYLCLSGHDWKHYDGHPRVTMPWPVDTHRFPWRQRERASTWVHNMGHAQWQYGKGTPELLEAWDILWRRGHTWRLTIRGQAEDRKVDQLFKQKGWGRPGARGVDWEVGAAIPQEDLYSRHDAFVFVEKYNGLSLPIQEAFASGMLIMTTYRRNDGVLAHPWLPDAPLVPVRGYEKVSIAREFERAIIDPTDVADMVERWYGQDITALSQKGRDWAQLNSWDTLRQPWQDLMAAVRDNSATALPGGVLCYQPVEGAEPCGY